MVGAPNTRGQKRLVGIVKWAPGTSVSEEIADIFHDYNSDSLRPQDSTQPLHACSMLRPGRLTMLTFRPNWHLSRASSRGAIYGVVV